MLILDYVGELKTNKIKHYSEIPPLRDTAIYVLLYSHLGLSWCIYVVEMILHIEFYVLFYFTQRDIMSISLYQ